MIQIGELVGDVAFAKADGSPFRLAEHAGKKIILIFLRHLA
jgi:hypothetical protein